MGIVIGMRCADGIVMASDRECETTGGLVAGEYDRTRIIGDTVAVAYEGCAGRAERLLDVIGFRCEQGHLDQWKLHIGDRSTLHARRHIAANMMHRIIREHDSNTDTGDGGCDMLLSMSFYNDYDDGANSERYELMHYGGTEVRVVHEPFVSLGPAAPVADVLMADITTYALMGEMPDVGIGMLAVSVGMRKCMCMTGDAPADRPYHVSVSEIIDGEPHARILDDEETADLRQRAAAYMWGGHQPMENFR